MATYNNTSLKSNNPIMLKKCIEVWVLAESISLLLVVSKLYTSEIEAAA